MSVTSGPLPVRVNPEELLAWLRQVARGAAGAGEPARVGAAARTLGLVDAAGRLTESGSALALGDALAAGAAMREALRSYQPYQALLEECASRGESTTRTDWAELWWGARGYGTSETNRREGMAMLGRLAHFAGLCAYVPGRRGHPSRLEWSGKFARPSATSARDRPAPEEAPSHPQPPPGRPGSAGRTEAAIDGVGHATLTMTNGRTAELRVPSRLSADDRRRLRALLEVLMDDS